MSFAYPKKKWSKTREPSKNTMEKWFSRYIRLRDTDDNGTCHCISCGKSGHPKYFDEGHFIKRNYYSIRYNEKNNNAQCYYCNGPLEGNSGAYSVALERKYGKGTTEELLALASHKGKLKEYECKLLSDEYRKKVQIELARAGLEKWW